MFLGEYEHTLDDKGRVAIPSRYRELLGEVVYVTVGFDRCLSGYTAERWKQIAEDFDKLPLSQSESRQLRRLFFSSAQDCPIDKTGRILIPPKLRGYAQITDQVVFAGNNTYFEIWSKAGWDAVEEGFIADWPKLSMQLESLGK